MGETLVEDEEKFYEYNRIVYVYSKDGKTLLHTYGRVKRIERIDNKYVLHLKHYKTAQKPTDYYTVSFSDELQYIETENYYECLTNQFSKEITLKCLGERFLKVCRDAGIIGGGGGTYECEILGMPKCRGWSSVLDWWYSKLKDMDTLELDRMVDKIFDQLVEKRVEEKSKEGK